MARERTHWNQCEVCNEPRPREAFRVKKPGVPGGKINVTVCQSCRAVQRDLTRAERKAQAELRRTEVHLCIVCKARRIYYKSRSGRCYRCAMDAQLGIISRTGEKATYTRKPVEAKPRERVARPVASNPPKPPRTDRPAPGPHGPNHPATPAQIKQRAKAQAKPHLYLQIGADEWWILAFTCQGSDCVRMLVTAGKCFTCSTGRPRSEKFVSKYEKGQKTNGHDQQNDADQAA